MALFLNNINVSPMSKYTVTLVSTLKNYLEGEGEVILPINTTQIEENCFKETNITSITIPNTVESIGWNAFAYCYDLKSVTFEQGSKCGGIGQSTFAACKALEEITIPASVEEIKNYAFWNCSALTTVNFEEGSKLESITGFNSCTSLKNITLPESLISISGFQDCKSLEHINIPSNVTYIGETAFSGCSALKEINLPNSVTSINYRSFDSCTSLTTVTIPSLITYIPAAFINCSSLKEVIIPSSVESITSDAFYGCSALTDIYINKPENSISGAPWYADNATIHWNSTGPEENV